jgi:TetR/AcrR family transcriptional regulator of autoinduction and epiphytic fitness
LAQRRTNGRALTRTVRGHPSLATQRDVDAQAPTIDPRVERSRRLICEAAIAELGEVGYGAMTIESIARRAGVGKATIYRHWNGKLDLIESALQIIATDMVIPDTGTARERARAVLNWLATYLGDNTALGSSCLPAMVSAAQYDDSVREFHQRFSAERRQVLTDIIDAGKASGEIRSHADARLLAEMLVGPLFYRRLMSGTAFPAERVDEILDVVFD